jgi:hypothetical protein
VSRLVQFWILNMDVLRASFLGLKSELASFRHFAPLAILLQSQRSPNLPNCSLPMIRIFEIGGGSILVLLLDLAFGNRRNEEELDVPSTYLICP